MTLTSEVRDTPSGADEPGPNGTGAPTNGGAATVAFPAQPPGEKPVEFWSTSAIRTALENDDLAVWQRIVVAIKRDPFGRTARQVEEILATTNPYGISKALSEVLARARTQLEVSEQHGARAPHRDHADEEQASTGRDPLHQNLPSAPT